MGILPSLFVLVVLFLLAGMVYQRAGSKRDAHRYPPLGRLFDVGGIRLHINSMGTGSPPVVFEAGIAATSLSWLLVQPEVAELTRTISYDRAGLGWSDPSPHPRGIGPVVDELRALLDAAGLETPRIFVAHSYGAFITMAYAARYPAEVAGMILVDPASASQWSEPAKAHLKMLRRGIALSRRGAWLARFGVVRFALARLSGGARTTPKLIARASSGRGTVLMERMVGQIQKLPPDIWPMIQAHWCDPKCFEGMARYLEALPDSAAEVAREMARGAFGEIPLVVLSSEKATEEERAEHERLGERSSRGRIEIVPASGHWIQLDRPDVVIRAIGEMVARCRS